ncbi:hypothetical protein [Fibrobacter sp. UBA4297]|uniref:hypothetical protein n=1 Tax=Fibrobacter sp. UBA4297 TaxID=1946536 RepID=UPI0025BE2A9F|nr:hypothetical protein [Fibrobacter sp. UBA4297]
MLKKTIFQMKLASEQNNFNAIKCLKNVLSLLESTSYTEKDKSNCVEPFCDLFWSVAQKIENRSELSLEAETKRILNFIHKLAVYTQKSTPENIYPSKGYALIRFLDVLASEKEALFSKVKDEFKAFCSTVGVLASEFSWLFEIKINSEYVFPIQKLMDCVIVDAENPTKDNLLQLIYSLQICNKINLEDDEDIRRKILEISQKYHIKILEMLCNRGELIGGDCICGNSEKNHILIAKLNNELLIRSTVSLQFSGTNSFVEKNDKDNIIAWYVVEEIPPHYKFTSLKDVLLGNNTNAKIKMLHDICEKKCFNVFFKDAIIVDDRDQSFIKFTNSFSSMEHIVFPNNIFYSGKHESFWDRILENKDGIRSVCLKSNRNLSNVLSMDFLASFHKGLSIEEPDYIDFINDLSEESFFQNQFFDLFIRKNLLHGASECLTKYLNFLLHYIFSKDFGSWSDETPISNLRYLVMPYKTLIPFENKINLLVKFLLEGSYFSWTDGEAVLASVIRKNAKNVVYVNGVTYDLKKIQSEDSFKIPEEGTKFWVIKKSNNEIYASDELIKIERTLKVIQSINDRCKITEEMLLKDHRFKDLVTIINNVGFPKKLRNEYGCPYNDESKILAIFKLLWHIQIYADEANSCKWYNLMKSLFLEKYYCYYALNAKEMDKKYVEKISALDNGETLFIAKESFGEGATLSQIIKANYCGDRGPLLWAFDSDKLNSRICKINGKGFCLSRPSPKLGDGKKSTTWNTITRIVFLTDNILSGSSTNMMLEFYYDNSCYTKNNEEDIRSYLKLNFKIKDIYETNYAILGKNVEIWVICVFALTDKNEIYGKTSVEKKFDKIGLKVDALQFVDRTPYRADDERLKNLLDELYGISISEKAKKRNCILRAHNMPADIILSKIIMNVEMIGGILQRKDEE